MLPSFYKVLVILAIIGYVFGHNSVNETDLAQCTRLRTYTSQYLSTFLINETQYNGKYVFLIFYVKSQYDVSIKLSSPIDNTTKIRETYEIILRSTKNRVSEIRSTRSEINAKYYEKRDASSNEWRPFWIRVHPEGLIQVGREIGSSAFLSWKQEKTSLMKINHVGFASHGDAEVNWTFQCPKNKGADLTRCARLTTTKYEYDVAFPIVDNRRDGKDIFITFYVKAKKEAHIVLSPTMKPTKNGEKAYEIILGGSFGSDMVAIRNQRGAWPKISIYTKNATLNPDEWRHFWIRVSPNGLIQVGQELGSPALISWKDSPPTTREIKINDYSVAGQEDGIVDWALDCPKRRFRIKGF